MIPSRRLTLFLLATLLGSWAMAQDREEVRLQGFAQHQKEKSRFNRAREQGERAYLEEVEQWENEKDRHLDAYKRGRNKVEMNEDGPEARADAAAKKEIEKQYEELRRAYKAEKSKKAELSREARQLPSEKEELGLVEDRPRYDYRKRAAFGAKPKFGKSASSSGSSGSSSGGSSSSFPPPPSFDDFGGDGGYVPAPNLPDDFGDIPPPPPPPPPFGDDFGGFGGEMGDGDFPPPPPPPPPFEGDNNF